jgi:hypothetical protein
METDEQQRREEDAGSRPAPFLCGLHVAAEQELFTDCRKTVTADRKLRDGNSDGNPEPAEPNSSEESAFNAADRGQKAAPTIALSAHSRHPGQRTRRLSRFGRGAANSAGAAT